MFFFYQNNQVLLSQFLLPNTYACWDKSDVWSLQTLWLAPCVSPRLPTLRLREVRSLSKIHGFTRNPWQALSDLCCNTLKSPIASEYTKVFIGPRSQKSRGKVKVSRRPVDWASMSNPLTTKGLVQVLSEFAEKMGQCPIVQKPLVLSLVNRLIFQGYW